MYDMRPFFPFYGSKWRMAKFLPASPSGSLIVEPFAGSAGYATRYGAGREVLLVEKDPVIAAVWNLLITAEPEQILALPDIADGTTVDEYGLADAERWLIGFWLNKGVSRPVKSPSKWMRVNADCLGENHWGPGARARIAAQLPWLSGWQVHHGDYAEVANGPHMWFIDPPYIDQGRHYVHGADAIDYEHLAQWAREREGHVMVTEQHGATWLPFEDFRNMKASSSQGVAARSREVLWMKNPIGQLSLEWG